MLKLTLEERLSKYNISPKRYDDETASLLAAGFTSTQADKIILRRSSKNAVNCVLETYNYMDMTPTYIEDQD